MIISRQEKYYALLLILIVISQSLPALVYSLSGSELPYYFLSEDGIYESVGAVSCLGASILFFYSFYRYPEPVDYVVFTSSRNLVALAFAILIFILFAEEISWGQRLLNIRTPEIIANMNYQREINLHNLTIIQSRNNLLSDLSFKLLILYLFALPLFVHSFSFFNTITKRLAIPVASLQIVLCVFIIRNINHINYEIFYKDGYGNDYLHIGEAYESNIEILLLILSLEYLFLCRKRAACQTLG